MSVPLNPKQVASVEGLLVFHGGRQEALTRLVVEKAEIRLFLAIGECQYGFLDKAYKN